MANTVYSASLIMTADVNQAKAQLKDLQQSLNSLMKTSHDSSPLGLTQEIAKATSDVAGLKAALQSATNTNTGKLDLSKFSQGLNAAKLDIKQVASSLQSLGPAGQQAFSQLATSIMSAEIPLKKTNKLLNDFKTTLGNTVKWQISSSMVNSLFGAMQHAYGYAKDLNKSLNDIRIVTGYSTDQMSKFAKEANNAAKALSTTTTQYTDAALIYYQQGLAEKDIKARTDATIKMANVTGESAKAVSDYMTAIWNNFDDGSKSIEYYADVMTALGAATASSTDEIAAGLEKFAAVSETVGLSYEYATAALATVTAETRQSADVVGNAFKTLFSRIQGLNLGETMDDGTDLNKYSSALAKVGINIKDTNGQIKQMDVILDELGAKWGTLSNDTQMALAQAVAGVRQYNQLISLMENWDTFKINLEVAEGAEGTLQEQADIYAESWQAAADRVEASFQDIYDSILNDEFFIKLTDFFGGLIDVIGNTVDGIGGMSGAFAALGIVATRVFGKDIAKGLSTLNYNLHPEKREQDIAKIRNDALTKLREGIDDGTFSGSISSEGYKIQADWQQQIIDKSEKLKANGIELNEIEKIRLGLLTDQLNQLLAQEREQANAVDIAKTKANNIAYRNTLGASEEIKLGYEKFRTSARNLGVGNSLQEIFTSMAGNTANEENGVESFKKSAKGLIASANKRGIDISAFEEELEGLDDIADKSGIDEFIQKLQAKIQTLGQEAADARKELEQLFTAQGREVPTDNINQEAQAQTNYGSEQVGAIRVGADVDAQQESNINNLNDIDESKTASVSQGFMALGDAISSTALVLTSFISLYNIWNDEDATAGEKLLTTLTTVATVLPMVTTAFSKTNIEMIKTLGSSLKAAMGFTTAGAAGVAAGAGGAAAGTGFAAAAAGLWSLLWPIGLVIAAVTALIAIISGISAAIDNSTFTLEEQLERAKLSSEELTEELKETKSAAEELNNAFDNYNSIVSKLDECTKGTKEYREALLEANNAAIELLNQHPELYNIEGAIDDSDGIIKITEKGQKALQESAEQKEQNINAALIDQRADVRQAELDIKESDLNKKVQQGVGQVFTEDFRQQGYDMSQYLSEQRVDSGGNGYTFTAEQRIDEAIQNAYNSLKNNPNFTKEDWDNAFNTAISGFEDELKNAIDYNAIYDWAESIRQSNFELQQAIDDNTYQTKLENENTVKQALGEKSFGKSDTEIALLGAEYDKVSSEIENIILKGLKKPARTTDLQDIDKIKIGEESYSGEDIWKKYNEAIGENFKLDDNSIIGGKDSRFIQYVDEEDGDTKKVSIETVASTIAAAEALKQLENGSINAADALKQISDIEVVDENGKGINVGDSIKSYIANGDMSGLNQQQLMDLTGGDGQFDEGEAAALFEGIDPATQEAIWKASGYASWEAFLSGFEADAESMDFSAIFANLKSGKIIDGNVFSEFSYDVQKNIASALDEAFVVGGYEASNKLYDILEAAGDKAGEVLELINSYNWDTGNAEDFANQLYKITGGSFSAKDAVEKFGLEMEAAGDRIPINELDDFIAKIQGLIVLLNNLKVGDIVSDDVVAQLEAQGIAIENYAIKTYEGWKLISQIPTEDLQKKSTEGLKTAQSAYERKMNNTTYQITDNDTDEVIASGLTTYDLAQRRLGSSSTSTTVKDINLMTAGMTDAEKEALFGQNIDNINKLLTLDADGKTVGEIADYDKMLEAIMDLYLQGQSGALSDQAIQTQMIHQNLSTNGLQSALNTEGFLTTGENGENIISDAGFEALKAYVSDIEELQYLLEDSEATALDFYKAINQFEKAKGVKAIAEATKKFADLEKGTSDYNTTVADLQKNIENTFGVKLDTKEIEDMADKWTDATTEAQKFEDIYKIVRDNISNMDNFEFGEQVLSLTPEVNTSKVKDALNVIQSELANNDIAWNCYINGDTTGLLTAMAPAIEQSGQLAGTIAALTNSNVEIIDDGMVEAFKILLETLTEGGTPEEMSAALDAFENTTGLTLGGFAPANIDGEVDYNTGSTGGGGGSSGSDKTGKEQLQDKQMELYEKKRDLLSTKRENMNPEDASKYIKEEIALLEKEQKILEKQIKSWKVLMKEKVEEFNEKYPEFEIKLTDDGEIANLADIYAAMEVKYDELMATKGIDHAEEWHKEMMEALDLPVGLQENIDENVALLAQKEKEQAELALQEITDRIDWRVKQIDFEIKKLNYYQEKLLIQAHGNKQTIEAMLEGFKYQEQEMLQLFEKGAALRQGIDELKAAKAQYPGNEQIFDEAILDYQSDLVDLNLDILKLRQEMEELVQNVLDLALDEMDIQNERIEKYIGMLDHFQNIIDLSGRALIDQGTKVQIGAMKVETLINRMSIAKQKMEGLTEATNLAQQALENRKADGDETSVKFWENQVEVLKREMEAATEEFLGDWEAALQAAGELFEMRVELAVQTMSDALSPFSSMELFQSNYEREKQIQEQYLDDATRLYELNKLNRDLNKNIQDQNDLLARSKLRDIQEEILALQKAGVEMSQYDLDVLQKKYDIRLAEIALMEAQNSKTSMRLIRDAGGNWTYAYDADEEKIEDATQKYEDAVYALDQLAKEYVNDVSDQLIANKQEFLEALADLDRNASDYQDQLLILQEQYMERERYLLDELRKGADETGLAFHETLYGQMTDLKDYEDAYNQFVNNSDVTIAELMTNYKDWQKVVEQAMNVAGTSWEDFGTDMDGTLMSLEEHIQALCEEISELVDVLMGYVAEAIGMVEEWQSKYSKRVDQELAMNEAAFGSGLGGGGVVLTPEDMATDWSRIISELSGGAEVAYDAYGNPVKDINEAIAKREAKIEKVNEGYSIIKEYSVQDWWEGGPVVFTPEEEAEALAKDTLDFIKKNTTSGATGMYTGDWPISEGMDEKGGKFAILHQKELVLNQQDTKNILDAVKMTRSQNLNKSIDDKVQQMLDWSNDKFSRLIREVQLPIHDIQPIEQKVEIIAEFPGVTDQYEIREALSNLSNDASQYLNIKRSLY